jgi:hypothetical protein
MVLYVFSAGEASSVARANHLVLSKLGLPENNCLDSNSNKSYNY